MVLVNGSEIWRDHQHILARHLLPADQVARLIDVAKEHGAGYWAIGSASDGGASLKVGIHHEDLAIISKLRDLLMSLGEFEVSASAPTNIEINPKGVSKATGFGGSGDACTVSHLVRWWRWGQPQRPRHASVGGTWSRHG